MTFSAILDLSLIVLLLVGGAGGFTIIRRLNRLMAAQDELKSALAEFDSAAGRADTALKRLEANGVSKGADLQAAAQRAEALVNELSVMTSAGERIADRIESAVRDVRTLGAAGAVRKPKRAA